MAHVQRPILGLDIHKRFSELLPPELLKITNPDSGEELTVVPGEYGQHDVKVARHVPVSPGAIPTFMGRFERVYSNLGRVARLMSYAMLQEGLQTEGLWSVARGLACDETSYKSYLNNCDLPRRNDLDGRGQLSE